MLILIFFGAYFRFNNLDKKFPWMDECITQIRVSQFQDSPLISFPEADSSPISVSSLKTQIEEKPQQTGIELIESKLAYIPEHPPLYYLLAARAANMFGNQFAVLRGLSAVISLFAFPAMYWLCYELFGSKVYGAIGVGVSAFSPLYILYAQEAREYSLWILAGILSSAALARSLRTNKRLDWLVYGVSLVLGLYTHLFFALNILAQCVVGVSLFLIHKPSFRHRWRNLFAMLLLSLMAFSPWVMLFFRGSARVDRHAQWFSGSFEFLTIAKRIAGSFVRVLYDNGFSDSTNMQLGIRSLISVYLPILLVLGLIGFSLIWVLKAARNITCIHIFSLLAIPLAAIIAGEVMTGKVLTQTRYMMPALLGVQLAVVFFLGQLFIHAERKSSLNPLAKVLVPCIAIASLLSCHSITNVAFWWNKGDTTNIRMMAEQVDVNDSLILAGNEHLPSITRLVYQLDPLTKLQFSSDLDLVDTNDDDVARLYYLGKTEDMTSRKHPNAELKTLYTLTPEFTLHSVDGLTSS